MIEADGIEAISFSYTAGVATAALAGLVPSEFSLILLLLSGVLTLDCTLRPKGSPARAALLFFLIGAFSFSCANVPHIRHQPFTDELEWTKRQIAGIPFADSKVNHLLSALLTGDRKPVDKCTIQAFRNSGAAHILALSGLHLGIIYGILRTLGIPLGRSRTACRTRSALTIFLCGSYTVLTGAGPSLVRALLYIILREILENSPHRRRDPVKIFCTALLIQLCLDPMSVKSLSFQLSYLAMAGISFVYPILHNWYPKTSRSWLDRFDFPARIWDACALSVSCQIFTAPLAWIRFGTFPEYFLLTNLLSLPLSEALMLCGLACLILEIAGLTFLPLLRLTEWLCSALEYCLTVIAGM